MRSLLLILLVSVSFISCTNELPIQQKDSSIVKKTIVRDEITLSYSYTEKTLSYGDNGLLILNLTYPEGVSPTENKNKLSSEITIKNGVLLDIRISDTVHDKKGMLNTEITIIFEAFLPGRVIIEPFSIELLSRQSGKEFKTILKTDTVSFLFNGDPSLTPEDADKELAEFIIPPGKDPFPILLFSIPVAVGILISVILIFHFKRKKRIVEQIDESIMYSTLMNKFKKDYLDINITDNLRPAFRELKKIIALSPQLLNKPEEIRDLINKCNNKYFTGSRISGETAYSELMEIFSRLQGKDSNDI